MIQTVQKLQCFFWWNKNKSPWRHVDDNAVTFWIRNICNYSVNNFVICSFLHALCFVLR